MSKGFSVRRFGLRWQVALFLISLFLLCLLVQTSGTQPDYLANPKTYRATYSVTITNISARMDTLEIWIPRPIEWDLQKDVKIEEVIPSPTRAYSDPVHQNGVYYWKSRNKPKKGAGLTLQEQFTFTAYDLIYDIDPGSVGQYDTGSQLYRTYTKSEELIEANDPAIRAKAQQIVGDETNPYNKARLIYDWVLGHMRYQLIEGLGGARFALERGYGECGDYAALFCALLRAVGVPARPVVGYWAKSGQPTHVWAEFYLPGYGWVPADPSIGDEGNPDRYFARLDGSTRLIFSKGFNIRLSSDHTADLFQTFYWWWQGSAGKTKADFSLTVEPIRTSGQLLFQDDFSDPESGWLLDANEDREFAYEDGKYSILAKMPDSLWWAAVPTDVLFSDFTVEVDLQQLSGLEEHNYGIVLREQGGSFYRFGISGAGEYALFKVQNDRWIRLLDLTESTAIRPGSGFNRLKVTTKGSQISLYANGELLASINDASFAQGAIGLYVEKRGTMDVHVHFDSIKVYYAG